MELIEKRKAEASLPDSEWFGEEGKAYKVEKGTKKKAGVDNSVTVKILGESTTVDDFVTTYISASSIQSINYSCGSLTMVDLFETDNSIT